MNKWNYYPLEQLGKITSSKRIFESEYVTDGIPFYRTKEIKELANKKTVSTELFITKARFEEIKEKFGIPTLGDILITAIGTIGEIYVIENNSDFYFKDGNILWLRDFKDINPYFLKYFLRYVTNELNNLSSGSAYKALPIEKLKKYKIPLPPIAEQKRIAAILDKADAIRRKRQEAIKLTEELGRSLFLDMFGDPVTNPKGWELTSLSKFGEIVTGNTPPRADLENYGDDIEWIKSDNITTPYHFLTQASESLSKQGKGKGRIVPEGSILVCCIAGSKSSIGKAAIANREVAFNQQINAIIPNENTDTYFLYSHFWVSQNLVQEKSTDSMKGLVSKSKFSSIKFLRPPIKKQLEFREKFLRFIKINKRMEKHLIESENLFNSLLQRAFKGEL
jgi:type I restriction enzyme S subunit